MSTFVCVCALPLPGNLVTGAAAAWASDPQLFALSDCQLPSMPCTNYWLWINPVLPLARSRPHLIFLADHAHTHTHTQTTHSQRDKRVFMWVFLKSRHPPGRLQLPRDTTDASQVFRSVACLLCTRLMFLRCFMWRSNTHTHKLCSIMIMAIRPIISDLLYKKRDFADGCHMTWPDKLRDALRHPSAVRLFSGNSLLNKCQVLDGVLLCSRVGKQKSCLHSVFSVWSEIEQFLLKHL